VQILFLRIRIVSGSADARDRGANRSAADDQSIGGTDPLRHPVVLLAYHVAVLMGTAVVQPPNLAKSATVE
jgi:glucosamine 6-phosphate synthetase-like amidotransferase/phosphosugar isomerase protein